jgi:transposase
MLKIEILEKDKAIIAYERYYYPHPHVMKKMEVLHLKGLGFISDEQICKIVGITGNTMRSYLKEYNRGGLDEIKTVKFYRPQSELMNDKESIESYFLKNPPVSVPHAASMIFELTGKKIGETQTRHFIKDILGFKFRKVGTITAQATDEVKKKSSEHFWSKN